MCVCGKRKKEGEHAMKMKKKNTMCDEKIDISDITCTQKGCKKEEKNG